MIQEICNIGNEHHIDTYHKIAIFRASQLPAFNHLTSDTAINDILTNIPDINDVLITDLLPMNMNSKHNNRPTVDGKVYKTSLSLVITPQDKNIQALLETYNNEEVVVLLSKHNTSHLYGTQSQPLIFIYSELNSPDPKKQKGYTVSIKGSGYGAAKIYEDIIFNIYTRGLAFELAQEL